MSTDTPAPIKAKWTGANGWYERPAADGERWLVYSVGRRWFITHPGERTPDAERPTKREALAYVDAIASVSATTVPAGTEARHYV